MKTVIRWINQYPRLTMWLVLGLGMVGILLFEAQKVGLQPLQWFWLVVITLGVAWLCVWIISWEDEDEEKK